MSLSFPRKAVYYRRRAKEIQRYVGTVPSAERRILDTGRDILFQSQPFYSITAHITRLTEYTDDNDIDELLAWVEIQGLPVDETPFRMDTMRQRDDPSP